MGGLSTVRSPLKADKLNSERSYTVGRIEYPLILLRPRAFTRCGYSVHCASCKSPIGAMYLSVSRDIMIAERVRPTEEPSNISVLIR